MEGFGRRLRELRERSGLTQEMVAERLGVTRQTVSKWELERSFPELPLVLPLARLFGLSADQLLGNTERRAVWEAAFREALYHGKAGDALRVAEAALCELPGDREFRYRLGCEEYTLALGAGEPTERERLLLAASEHLREASAPPGCVPAADVLALALLALGRREEAEALARRSGSGDRLLLNFLEGEEALALRRKLLTDGLRTLLGDLIHYASPDSLAAAETIICSVALGAEGPCEDLLRGVFFYRALLYCREGHCDAAASELEKLLRVLRTRSGRTGSERPRGETVSFLQPFSVPRTEKEQWTIAARLLEDERLAPLREREDVRAMRREIEERTAEGEQGK